MTRTFVLLIGLTAVLGAGACGRQDRYEVVQPPLPEAIVPVDWAGPEELPYLQFEGVCRAAAAWAADDLLMVDSGHLVVWLHGQELRVVRTPLDEPVVGVVCRPDGSAACLDYRGNCFAWRNGSWEADGGPGGFRWFRGLTEDGQGRLVGYGDDGALACQENAGWVFADLPDSLDLLAAWAPPGGDLLAVAKSGALVRQVGAQWLVEALPWSETFSVSWPPRIDGDTEGRLVIYEPGRIAFLTGSDGIWTSCEGWPSMEAMYWEDGRLLGIHSYRGLHEWDGNDWVLLGSQSDLDTYRDAFVLPAADQRLLIGQSGCVAVLDGTDVQEFSPVLGYPAGLARWRGELHLLLDRGAHLVWDADHWRWLGRPLQGTGRDNQGALAELPDGDLVLVGFPAICRFDGQDYTPLVESVSGKGVCHQGDGSFLVLCDAGRVGRLDPAGWTWLPSLAADWNEPHDLQTDPAGGFWALDRWRLGHVTEAGVETVATFADWWAVGLSGAGEDGVLVFGDTRLLRIAAGAWTDLTPQVYQGGEWDPVALWGLCPVGEGGWLAPSDVGLLSWDGTVWRELMVPADHTFWSAGNPMLLPQGDGSILARTFQRFYLIRPEELP